MQEEIKKLMSVFNITILILVGITTTVGIASAKIPTYSIQDIGAPQGLNDGVAFEINNVGQIVGWSFENGFAFATLWQNGISKNIGTLPGGISSGANAINDNGDIVGFSRGDCGNGYCAVLWKNGIITNLGTLPGGDNSEARSINNLGQIVGYGDVKFGEFSTHAVLWENGNIKDIGTLNGQSFSYAFRINNVGQIVGDSFNDMNGPYRATIWENGEIKDLGTLPGGSSSIASDINDKGEIVGISTLNGYCTEGYAQVSGATPPEYMKWQDQPCNLYHAVKWEQGNKIKDLGTLPGGNYSDATNINNLGQIVGYSDTASGQLHAVIWDKNGKITDLGTLNGGPFSLAYGIDDKGDIVGTAGTGVGAAAVLWTQN